uniref:RING-type domain-containing protein n=1 Tax=Grammatophora oceanica TaxID=210454 RepID=A0A7S1UNI2_9STRA|mmetsp:Transcript_14406/g.21134  ORF Transcript_14406/g.21134 Transcript_14406/m.21134 type:complete len:194 (+) Transcript_14406:122-703(+)|eukprot:CAMPEP_0194044732 /NCGR_PEP_ID=MMETSP0009_2-20130614/16151_1 /TAXON_ID=210454 /ORGANISM="Grammatophora oceanica, Strain CCMP 410" /LENGTH=193 /DNA_ID=CAMNT_0038689331 /DNA_START=46 /DNA_END=627 /DNA_ORIENTATION=+
MQGSNNYTHDRVASMNADSTTTSIAMFILTVAASEILVIMFCKLMAWYSDTNFYSERFDWIHDFGVDESPAVGKPQDSVQRLADIQTHLATQRYRQIQLSGTEATTTSSCPICLIDFESAQTVSFGDCRHMFCTECITEWLLKEDVCPCCRYRILPLAESPSSTMSRSSSSQQLSSAVPRLSRSGTMDPSFLF